MYLIQLTPLVAPMVKLIPHQATNKALDTERRTTRFPMNS